MQPAVPRPARPGLPAAGLRHPRRKVPGPAGPDDRQRRAGGDRRRPRPTPPAGAPSTGSPPCKTSLPGPRQRPPRGRGGDRQACARPPGAATDRCDRRRPADQPPESYPRRPGQANDQERQAPPGPRCHPGGGRPRTADRDQPARPGDPGPSGAAGDTGPYPARSIGTVRGSGREAASSQWMVWLARAGLTARGVNYLLIGALAVAIGLGSRGKEADRVGALRYVAGKPGGARSGVPAGRSR